MENQAIHVFYYPSVLGYSAYSSEIDGLEAHGKTLDQLFEKVKHLMEVRIKTLLEIGRLEDAQKLRDSELVFVEK